MADNFKIKKPATMRDVAELAGVSQPTVSRVLNQKSTSIRISPETRDKVLAAVEELGYRPNMHARSLRTQQTNLIAILVADITNSFYPQIARSVQQVARQQGYDVMISNSDHIYEHEKHFCEAIIRRSVDGIIMVPIHLTEDDLHDLYHETGTPIAVLGQHVTHPYIDVVYADDEQAVYDVTRWLIDEQGHTSVGYVGVPDMLPPGPRRRRGFQQAMADVGLPVQPEYVYEGDFTLEGGRRVGVELLQLAQLPSALMVANDNMALGVMLALQEGGVRIPQDVAVVGYDNIPEASIIRPGLTTIEQDSADIGYRLANLLFERIQQPDSPAQRIQIRNRLIIREST